MEELLVSQGSREHTSAEYFVGTRIQRSAEMLQKVRSTKGVTQINQSTRISQS